MPWCWGREDKQIQVFGVQAHGHLVAIQGSPGILPLWLSINIPSDFAVSSQEGMQEFHQFELFIAKTCPVGATANPPQGHTVWMDISAKTSPGYIPVTPYEQTQPAGTDRFSREISKV